MTAAALQSFGFEGQTVRVMDQDGCPWFVAQDVCACLEIANSRDAVERLDADEKGVGTTDTLGGAQDVQIVSESGLYALIFKSRKPAAVRFRKWVTAEVLPTLRRTGRYELAPANDVAGPLLWPVGDHVRRINQVSLTTKLFGLEAGRWMYEKIGMPMPPQHLIAAATPVPGPAVGWTPFTVRDWIEECTERDPDARTAAGALYSNYQLWCAENRRIAETQRSFGDALARLGFSKIKSGSGNIWRRGLKLLN